MAIIIHAAIAQNGVIGFEGKLPWHLSSDLRRFKSNTLGKPVLMGRKTWESLGRPLPERFNIVISRDPHFRPPGAEVVDSPSRALDLAQQYIASSDPSRNPFSEIAVIGGETVFHAFLPLSSRLHITHVLADVPGHSFFPSMDWAIWEPTSSVDCPAGDRDTYSSRHVVYERIQE